MSAKLQDIKETHVNHQNSVYYQQNPVGRHRGEIPFKMTTECTTGSQGMDRNYMNTTTK